MTRYSIAAVVSWLLLATSAALFAADAATTGPDRWVFVARNLATEQRVEDIRRIVETAHKHGLNGMLWAAGLEGVGKWGHERLGRLERVKAICGQNRIEIIPIIWSVGYGSGLGRDPNFAAGLPCRDVPFRAEGGDAQLVRDPDLRFANPGFEEFEGDHMKGYQFHDRPGQVSFADTRVFKSGRASLRLEGSGTDRHGHARVMQTLSVKPYRQYRITCWVKTEDLEPAKAFKIQVYSRSGPIVPCQFNIPVTTEWRKLSLMFNSLQWDEVRVYAGLWGGRSGRIWFDDFHVEALALVNVLRRPGTPVSVASEDGSVVYEEGRDYERVVDGRMNLRRPREDSPAIHLTPRTRIQEGERLRVGYYHGMAVNRGQVSVCMSEPKLYEYWRESAAAIKKHLSPSKWFLSMDEIRAGGSCAACQARHLTMGEILGDCITKQTEIIRDVCPQAKVYIWSDMLDPNHNAHGDYYLVDGDFTGSWEHVPRDLVIGCWYFRKREQSMSFFSKLGFETLAGAYYDGDTLDNIEGWLDTIGHTPKCRGIMYTTWRNKYALLPGFGDLVARRLGGPRPARQAD